MRIVVFCHSLVSDWNHGNAHFLRGICSELIARGHDVHVLEPRGGWSRASLVDEHGEAPLEDFARAFPQLRSAEYDLETLDLDAELDHADLVLVHEWSPPALVRRVGEHHARGGDYRLLFHDTHHRAATQPEEMAQFDLRHYDGVLAFGDVIRSIYLDRDWAERAWTWHEAADTRVFRPLPDEDEADLVWIGNWGDDERAAELERFLFAPAVEARLALDVHGVRYPPQALKLLAAYGARYGGWLPNPEAPRVFAAHLATVHVPRRFYATALAGIPTIRVFEALACGIPLLSAPWPDTEHLFRPGLDYLVARDQHEMVRHMKALRDDPDLRAALSRSGLETIRTRHTCAHRVDQLLHIAATLAGAKLEPAR
jgi:spore maturation protein CgeB